MITYVTPFDVRRPVNYFVDDSLSDGRIDLLQLWHISLQIVLVVRSSLDVMDLTLYNIQIYICYIPEVKGSIVVYLVVAVAVVFVVVVVVVVVVVASVLVAFSFEFVALSSSLLLQVRKRMVFVHQ